jgi:hypothetical protein
MGGGRPGRRALAEAMCPEPVVTGQSPGGVRPVS